MKLSNVEKALVEGNTLVKIRQKLDNLISGIFRYFWAKKQQIQNNKIVFMGYGDRYECNLKYIAEEMLRQELPYELIWLAAKDTKKLKEDVPAGVTVVKKSSYMGLYHIATAKVWIDNALNFLWYPSLRKKKGQVYINTWHGSMGLKRIGGETVQNRKWRNVAKKCNETTDYCISDSAFETEVFRTTYWKDVPILEYGHARNDIFFENNAEKVRQQKEAVLEKLKLIPQIPEDMEYLYPKKREQILNDRKAATDLRFVLYAPTFRDNGRFDCYNIDFSRLIEALQQRFGGTWKVLLRFHFHNRGVGSKIFNEETFINVTDYPDMQELLTLADVGITDYSSWICDYALTIKPAFIYAADLEEYNNERGLYYPLETTPFPLAVNNDELISTILRFDCNQYSVNLEAFLQDKGCLEDGHASERVVKLINKLIEGENMP